MDRPSPDEIARKQSPVELRVENISKYPVVYYGGTLHAANKPVSYFCQLKGTTGNGVVIPPGGTYAHEKEMSGKAMATARNAETEMRYFWAPVREAWFARTFLPAVKSRLPDKCAHAIPEIRARRENEPLHILPETARPAL
ncbi:hypothetical protein [Roseimicrobium gellanilyticum]|nr:hypothetical protein [Roseimicrobium gellanilyticum]